MTGLIFGDLMTTLSNLVVSIGVDSKDLQKGIKDAQGALQGFKSSAMQMSAIIAGIGSMAMGAKVWSKGKLELKAHAELLGTTAEKLQSFKTAVEATGASGDEAVRVIENMSLAQRKLATGHGLGYLEELIKNGSVVQYNGHNMVKVISDISKQWGKLTAGQKQNLIDTLGFSPEAVNLFNRGGNSFEKLVDQAETMLNPQKEYTKTASEFVEKFTMVQAGFTRFIDVFENRFAKKSIEWMDDFIRFFEENPDKVKKLENAVKFCADNVDKLFLGLAAITALKFSSSIANMIASIGNLGKALVILGKNPTFIALTAIAGAFALVAKNGGKEEDELFSGTYENFQKTVDQKLSDYENDPENRPLWEMRKSWTREKFEEQKKSKMKRRSDSGFLSFFGNDTPSTDDESDSVSITDTVAKANSVQEQEAQVAEQERKTQERAQRESQNGTGNTLNVNLNLDSSVIKRITAKMYADANGRMRFNGAR